jgi:predicted membrane channel-forming protein YqfA (hemolysin III family)
MKIKLNKNEIRSAIFGFMVGLIFTIILYLLFGDIFNPIMFLISWNVGILIGITINIIKNEKNRKKRNII